MNAPPKKVEKAKPVANPKARRIDPAEAVAIAQARFPRILDRLAK